MRRRAESGFTLTELMVTLAIMAIVTTIALPSFRDTIQRNRVVTANNEVVGGISLARTEAIRTARGGGICGANADGTDCATSGTTWSNGWIVWADADATLGFNAGTDTIVRRIEPNSKITLSVPDGASDLKRQIVFNRRGMLNNGVRTITLQPADCAAGKPLKRTLDVKLVGQVTTTQGNCS